MAAIKPLNGDDLGVFKSEHYIIVQWDGPQKVVFSFTQQGRAITMHFATNSQGLRHLKAAITDFIEWAVYAMPWCKVIIGVITKPSVIRLARKFGFVLLHSQDKKFAYMKVI